MKNNLFTKVVAWLLCALMVVGYLPNVAFAANDWEGEMDEAEQLLGSEANPEVIGLGNVMFNDADGHYYKFSAYANGYLTMDIYSSSFEEAPVWAVEITNKTQNSAIASYSNEDEAPATSNTIKYTAEDEIIIYVLGELDITLSFVNGWGTEADPIKLLEQYNSFTIPAGETRYYQANFSGTDLTVYSEPGFVVNYNGTDYADAEGVVGPVTVTSANPRMPVTFSITNNTEMEQYYSANFEYPLGSDMNPEEAYANSEFTATIAEGSQGYFYKFVAYANGTLTVTVSGSNWTYVINNTTAGTYGDQYNFNDETVVNSQTFEYTEGDEILVIVNTLDPADPWNHPAGEVNVKFDFINGLGTADSPFVLSGLENTVEIAEGDPVYYQLTGNGMILTITGEGDFSVINGEETIAAVDGVVSFVVNTGSPWQPLVFAIDSNGTYDIVLTHPVGSMDNPASAQLGDNTASISAGSQGYYWSYIADKEGELIITISGADNWFYTVNNLTTYSYGDGQWSDSDPVVNPTTITVAKGDKIEILVKGYDPANPWEAPAATLTVNLAYKQEIVEPTVALEFQTASLTLANSLAINFKAYKEIANEYTDLYAIFTMNGKSVRVDEYYVSGKYIVFDFPGIAANHMNSVVSAVLYGKAKCNGQDYVSTKNVQYGVYRYCQNMLGKYWQDPAEAKFCTAMVDLLNYGAAAQLYNNYKTDNLANNWLNEGQKALATQNTPAMESVQGYEVEIENPKVTFSGASLVLDSAVVQRIRVNINVGDVSDYTYVVRTENGKTWTYTAEDLVETDATDAGVKRYYIYMGELFSTQMSTKVFYTVYEGDTIVSHTFRYSTETFAYKYQDSTNPPHTGELLVAMIKYGNAVKAYAG